MATSTPTQERRTATVAGAPPAPPHGVTQRIAVWSATHRWTAIGVWALFIVLAASISMAVAPKQATNLDLGVGESGRAAQTAADAGHPDPVVENALLTARAGTLDLHEADAAARALVGRLGAFDGSLTVESPVGGGTLATIRVPLAG